MTEHHEIIEQLAAYALGVLDPDEAQIVAAHLANCTGCRAELAVYEHMSGQLASMAPATTPSPQLKTQLLQQIQSERQIDRPEPWWRSLVDLLRKPAPAWSLGLVGLALVLVLGVILLSSNGSPETLQTVALAGTSAAPEAEGLLVISADGEYGSLVVDGLPKLDQAHQYQLWLIKNDQRSSGGVFSVHEGYAAIQISSPQPLSSYEAFGITIEPAGGSAGPTGQKVLGTP